MTQYLPFLPYALLVIWMIALQIRRFHFIGNVIAVLVTAAIATFVGWIFGSPWIGGTVTVVIFIVVLELMLNYDEPDSAGNEGRIANDG